MNGKVFFCNKKPLPLFQYETIAFVVASCSSKRFIKMILKIFLLLFFYILPPSAFGQIEPSSDTLSVMNLASTLNFVPVFDGPADIAHADTIPTTNTQPTLELMQYYNYYAAAMYCQYELETLSCDLCKKFKNDVYDKTGELIHAVSALQILNYLNEIPHSKVAK